MDALEHSVASYEQLSDDLKSLMGRLNELQKKNDYADQTPIVHKHPNCQVCRSRLEGLFGVQTIPETRLFSFVRVLHDVRSRGSGDSVCY
jgi:hypothetical protein